MKKSKRIVALILAIVSLFSVVSFSSSAFLGLGLPSITMRFILSDRKIGLALDLFGGFIKRASFARGMYTMQMGDILGEFFDRLGRIVSIPERSGRF